MSYDDVDVEYVYRDELPENLRLSKNHWRIHLENMMAEQGFPKFYTIHFEDYDTRVDRTLISAKNLAEAAYKLHLFWHEERDFFGDYFYDFLHDYAGDNLMPVDVLKFYLITNYVNNSILWITEVETIL